jgi:hypothetical protein
MSIPVHVPILPHSLRAIATFMIELSTVLGKTLGNAVRIAIHNG